MFPVKTDFVLIKKKLPQTNNYKLKIKCINIFWMKKCQPILKKKPI